MRNEAWLRRLITKSNVLIPTVGSGGSWPSDTAGQQLPLNDPSRGTTPPTSYHHQLVVPVAAVQLKSLHDHQSCLLKDVPLRHRQGLTGLHHAS